MLINIILVATVLEIIIFSFLILAMNNWISQVRDLTLKVNKFQHRCSYNLKIVKHQLIVFNCEIQRKFTIKNSDVDFFIKMFFGLMVNILIPQVLPSGKFLRVVSLISGDLWKNKNKLLIALAAFILKPKFSIRHR